MRALHPMVRSGTVASVLVLLTLVTGCSKPTEQDNLQSTPSASAQSRAGSKLGDLTVFHSIAQDVATLVNSGDLHSAKARIKDLEVAWDADEAGLKPRAVKDWHVLDNAIDESLSALRAGSPSQADCEVALKTLLKTFDALEGKA